jgi:hypothetical protein
VLAITTSEVSAHAVTRERCSTRQPSSNGSTVTGRQPPVKPGARDHTARPGPGHQPGGPGHAVGEADHSQQAAGPQQPPGLPDDGRGLAGAKQVEHIDSQEPVERAGGQRELPGAVGLDDRGAAAEPAKAPLLRAVIVPLMSAPR